MASQPRRRLRWLAGTSSLVLASVSMGFSAQGTEQSPPPAIEEPTPATEQPTPTAEETDPSEDDVEDFRQNKLVYFWFEEEELHVGVLVPSGGTVTLEYQGKEYNLTEDESARSVYHGVYEVNTGIRSLTDDTPILRYTFNGVSGSKEITFFSQLQKDLERTPISRIKKEKGSKITEEDVLTIFERADEWYKNAGHPATVHFGGAAIASTSSFSNSSLDDPEKIVVPSVFNFSVLSPSEVGKYYEDKTDFPYKFDIEYDIEKFIERVEPSTSTPVDTPSSAPQNQDTPVSTDKQADPTPTTPAAANAAPTTPAASTSAQTKKALAFTGAHTTPLLALATILGATGLIMVRRRNTTSK